MWRGLGGFDLSAFDVLGRSSIRSAIQFTFWQALLSTVATFVLALPLTAVLANVDFRGRSLIWSLITVPFVMPTVVVAGAMIATSERFGLNDTAISLESGTFAIVAAHVFFNISVVVRTVGGFWTQLSRDGEEAARLLGASTFKTYWTVTLPRLRRSIASALTIVFLFSFTSFGVILILGKSRIRTLETEIFRYAVTRTDFETASALAVVQLIAVLSLVLVNRRLAPKPNRERTILDRARVPRVRKFRLTALAVVATTMGLLALPVFSLIESSLSTGTGYGFDHYSDLGTRPPPLTVSPHKAITNSLSFAFVAMSISVFVGVAASIVRAHGRRSISAITDAAYFLPLGTSAVTLGFGILLAFDTEPFDLRSSWMIIPIAQSLVGIPFVIRTVGPALEAIDPNLPAAAASLGAGPFRRAKEVIFPLTRRALASGAAFSFAISLGEFGATSFVGRRADLLTMPLAIARLLGRPGDQLRGQAMAMSVILLFLTAIAVIVLDRSSRSRSIL